MKAETSDMDVLQELRRCLRLTAWPWNDAGVSDLTQRKARSVRAVNRKFIPNNMRAIPKIASNVL